MSSIINLNDPQIWVAFSFILFFIFFGSLIWKKFSKFLDDKIKSIKDEITYANSLHKEAKELLSEEIKKFQGLDAQINSILEDGKKKTHDLYVDNKEKISSEIIKLEKSSLEKLNYHEKKIIAELQAKITKNAINLTEKFLLKEFNNETQLYSISNAIKEVETSLVDNKNKPI